MERVILPRGTSLESTSISYDYYHCKIPLIIRFTIAM
jgi:hypothetical protein